LVPAGQKSGMAKHNWDSGAGLTLHHCSLDPCGRHRMIQRSIIFCGMPPNSNWDLVSEYQTFACPGPKSGMALWLNNEDSGAGLALHHHSFTALAQSSILRPISLHPKNSLEHSLEGV
jgi:hypothetical protein